MANKLWQSWTGLRKKNFCWKSGLTQATIKNQRTVDVFVDQVHHEKHLLRHLQTWTRFLLLKAFLLMHAGFHLADQTVKYGVRQLLAFVVTQVLPPHSLLSHQMCPPPWFWMQYGHWDPQQMDLDFWTPRPNLWLILLPFPAALLVMTQYGTHVIFFLLLLPQKEKGVEYRVKS